MATNANDLLGIRSSEDVVAVRQAVLTVADRRWDPAALAARAREFSRERFLERLLATIAEHR